MGINGQKELKCEYCKKDIDKHNEKHYFVMAGVGDDLHPSHLCQKCYDYLKAPHQR